jgi:cytidylate kinase
MEEVGGERCQVQLFANHDRVLALAGVACSHYAKGVDLLAVCIRTEMEEGQEAQRMTEREVDREEICMLETVETLMEARIARWLAILTSCGEMVRCKLVLSCRVERMDPRHSCFFQNTL